MEESVRTALQAELARQEQAGLHPSSNSNAEPLIDSMRNVDGTPIERRHTEVNIGGMTKDPAKVLVTVAGIEMTLESAIKYGGVVRQPDGKVLSRDEMAAMAAQQQSSGNDAAKPDADNKTDASPAAGSFEEAHAELGVELGVVDQVLQQHASSSAAGLALAYYRGADVSAQLDVLVRAGVVEDMAGAVAWLEQTADHVQTQLSGVLDKAGLDSVAVLRHIAEDKNLAPLVERSLLQWTQSGDAAVWRPVIQQLHDSGKLAQMMKGAA